MVPLEILRYDMMELPEECWELIFNRLGHHYRFQVISLVSKHLLSVSSRLKRTLTIDDPTIRVHCNLSKFFQRFNNLSCLKLTGEFTEQEFNDIVLDIARSGLNLDELHVSVCDWTKIGMDVLKELGFNMNKLKTLILGENLRTRTFGFQFNRGLNDSDLLAIACSMPQLQELYFSPADLNGITLFPSSEFRQLRRIDLSEKGFVSDEGIIELSLNCKFLTELAVGGRGASCKITENSIGFALRHCENLTSLRIVGIKSNITNSVSSVVPSSLFSFENSISHARALNELDIRGMVISDALLVSIAKARLPLRKLALRSCKNFTYSGLLFLLQNYQYISHLTLGEVKLLTDKMMDDLSMFLGNVTHLQIWDSPNLTGSSFFILTGKCQFLVELRLDSLFLGQGDNKFWLEQTVNHNIESLKLSDNTLLIDESLKRYGLLCPNLKLLSLSGCFNITEIGIGEILKSCSMLRHLEVESCKGKKILGTGSELFRLNLEVLQLSYTEVDDIGMALIGTRCHGLLQLKLKFCSNVTVKGVKELLVKCVNLSEIDLGECSNVWSSDIVPLMISTRPSLRKIFAPGGHVSKEEQRNLFLRHGCVVCNH